MPGPRCGVVEVKALRTPLYAIKVVYTSPADNHREHTEVMKTYGLGRSTASARPMAFGD